MFEFEIIDTLTPNTEILEIIKNYTFTIKNGKVNEISNKKDSKLAKNEKI